MNVDAESLGVAYDVAESRARSATAPLRFPCPGSLPAAARLRTRVPCTLLLRTTAPIVGSEGDDCGAKFTYERWEAVQPTEWGTVRDTHPPLCDGCKEQAVAQQEQVEGERREQDKAVPEQKPGRWFSRRA
ncbi:hypothetical protein [Streptomyces sirii]|uniref:hypothetical protein n=1 Tax=Streptomyces sirii TaxID=3127701 RepID=UPI003D3650A5